MRPDRTTLCACVVTAAALLACKKLSGGGGEPAASASVAASAAAAAPAPADPVCKVESQRVWAAGANPGAGLTATALDDRIAIGAAIGNRAAVLVFDRNGEGSLIYVQAPAGSAIAKGVPAKDGARELHRITPTADAAGRIHAYADYRDLYKSKRRRVACEAVAARASLFAFDGKALIDPDAKPAAKPAASAPAAAPPAAGAPAAAPAPKPAATSAGAPPASAAPATSVPVFRPKPVVGLGNVKFNLAPGVIAAPGKLREIRDCRSFVDAGGKDVWAIGSELFGERREGGRIAWQMRFLVMPGHGREAIVIHQVDLPDPPGTLYTLESPVAERLADGSYVVAGRYRGALHAWTLGAGKQRKSGPRVYRGGSPTLPHFIPDGLDFLLLVSQEVTGDRYELRFGRIDGQKAALPATLERPPIDGLASMAEPTIGRAGKQRWLSYHGGKRREGELVIVPVDAQLAPQGRSYVVTRPDQTSYESNLFGLENGKLLVVYLRNASSGPELVSETLSCEVRK